MSSKGDLVTFLTQKYLGLGTSNNFLAKETGYGRVTGDDTAMMLTHNTIM